MTDKLLCYCWCGKTSKPIPAEMVRAGETYECDMKCRAMFEEHGFRPSWTAQGNSKYHHGTNERWTDGCRCTPCCNARGRYLKERST